jgi:hypothetical protein
MVTIDIFYTYDNQLVADSQGNAYNNFWKKVLSLFCSRSSCTENGHPLFDYEVKIQRGCHFTLNILCMHFGETESLSLSVFWHKCRTLLTDFFSRRTWRLNFVFRTVFVMRQFFTFGRHSRQQRLWNKFLIYTPQIKHPVNNLHWHLWHEYMVHAAHGKCDISNNYVKCYPCDTYQTVKIYMIDLSRNEIVSYRYHS